MISVDMKSEWIPATHGSTFSVSSMTAVCLALLFPTPACLSRVLVVDILNAFQSCVPFAMLAAVCFAFFSNTCISLARGHLVPFLSGSCDGYRSTPRSESKCSPERCSSRHICGDLFRSSCVQLCDEEAAGRDREVPCVGVCALPVADRFGGWDGWATFKSSCPLVLHRVCPEVPVSLFFLHVSA